jgi:uncharacterized membrane protein
MFSKERIHRNKNFLWLGAITLVPAVIFLRDFPTLWGVLAVFCSICFFHFDPSIKEFRRVHTIRVFYFSSMLSGVFIGGLFQIFGSSTPEVVYLIWVAYFGISGIIAARTLSKEKVVVSK